MRKIAELSRREAAVELGYRNVAQVLRHAVRWDLKTARQWVARAEFLSGSLVELPVTAVAMAEGALSGDHISVVAEVMRELPPEAERSVVEFALAHEPSAVRVFGRELAYRLFQRDAEPGEPLAAEPPANRLRMAWRGEQLEVSARLDKIAGAKLEALIDPLAKPRPTTPEEGPDARSRAEREGDAFADLLDLVLRADRLPEHGGEPVSLTLTMSYDALVRRTGLAVLDNRVRVPASLVRRLACNAGVIPVVLGGRSEAMDIGRKARTFPASIRRLLVARDQGCAFPGCDRPPKHCDAHHVRPWSEGGETSMGNAVLLCRHHHTLIHQSDWEVKLHDGTPTFIPPAWLDPARVPRTNTRLHTGRHVA
ncbi:HNH endonuclease [Lentzea flaviverrucosa]|uniref:HNH endonuclease n=2 Tax=Lentzea flaviverrucosa TaxID=200379 RepID=A0A1H9XVM6_9PSEU|nr:HNH endonuclease [Lentzea flaviverrucosa]SES50230.1 HNH endonuclease [Lentzea flaviverrucosa]